MTLNRPVISENKQQDLPLKIPNNVSDSPVFGEDSDSATTRPQSRLCLLKSHQPT